MEADALQQAAQAIETSGYVIQESAIDPALCDRLVAAIETYEQTGVGRSLENKLLGFKTARYFDLLNLDDAWQALPQHAEILPLAHAILGEDCLLNTYSTVSVEPGEDAQLVHVDDGTFFDRRDSPIRNRPRLAEHAWRRPIVLNAIVALSDFTKENGATRIVPGSHLLAYPRNRDNALWHGKSVPAVMPKGSIAFIEGQCFHAGGANRSDAVRHAVAVDFCAGFLRTQENFLLTTKPERLLSYSKTLQRLLGLGLSSSGLGHVFNRQPARHMQPVAIAKHQQREAASDG